MTDTLRLEVETYNRELEQLLQTSAGKFVLIKDSNVIETFDTYEDALKCGYAKFKLDPFFVKQIADPAQIAYFSRDLIACRA